GRRRPWPANSSATTSCSRACWPTSACSAPGTRGAVMPARQTDLKDLGRRGPTEPAGHPFPPGLDLSAAGRWPTRLADATIRAVLANPLPASPAPGPDRPAVSVVVVTFDNLAFTRLCLESLIANTDGPDYEVVVVDNGSVDGTPDYLRE